MNEQKIIFTHLSDKDIGSLLRKIEIEIEIYEDDHDLYDIKYFGIDTEWGLARAFLVFKLRNP